MTTTAQATLAATAAWRVRHRDDRSIIFQHGDAAEPSPADWQQRLRRALVQIGGVAAVGAKRLRSDGAIRSMGELIVHPKGFHAIGEGLPGEAHQFALEVDAICGGAVAVDARALDEAGGLDADATACDMLCACLRMRIAGGRIFTLPEVTAVHDQQPFDFSPQVDARFETEFGFSRGACDMDAVIERWAGSGLLWNARFTAGEGVRYRKYEHRPCLHWSSYESTPVYRSRADAIVNFLGNELPRGATLLDFGCGDGLFSHLLTTRGFEVTGIDIEKAAIEQAQRMTSTQRNGTFAPPRFILSPDGKLPADRKFDGVVMLDVIEHLRNPARVLRALHHTLKPGGALAVVTPEAQYGGWSDPVYHVTEYTNAELLHQLSACGYAPVKTGRIGAPYRDIIALVRCVANA